MVVRQIRVLSIIFRTEVINSNAIELSNPEVGSKNDIMTLKSKADKYDVIMKSYILFNKRYAHHLKI